MFCTFAITSLFAVNAQNALRGLYGPRSSNMDTQDVDNNLSEGKAVDNKMFFWPIWTARSNISDIALPEGAERMLAEGKDVDNKMFFWPIWTKSDAPTPQDMDRILAEGKDVDNKMFFWPIWTKSDTPLPEGAERILAE